MSSKTIIISNTEFDYDFGCRLLKLKYENCPFPELSDFWESITPATFSDIAKLDNIEERRVAMNCMGIERLIKEVEPTLVHKQTINKKTTYINHKGVLENKGFKDTYELYKVSGDKLSRGMQTNRWNKFDDVYYVKCKDTSTNRDYIIFVDLREVYNTNIDMEKVRDWSERDSIEKHVTAVQCIAWTIQTNISKGNIEKIVRQGDCILIKPKNNDRMVSIRHLTEKEYKELLVAES